MRKKITLLKTNTCNLPPGTSIFFLSTRQMGCTTWVRASEASQKADIQQQPAAAARLTERTRWIASCSGGRRGLYVAYNQYVTLSSGPSSQSYIASSSAPGAIDDPDNATVWGRASTLRMTIRARVYRYTRVWTAIRNSYLDVKERSQVK